MPSYNRIDRISEEIRKALAEIIRELKDPRIPAMISVLSVDVTKDLSSAKAYISIYGDEKKQKQAIAALKNAAGFIRGEVAHKVKLRAVPEFTFIADHSIEYGSHINEILKKL